MRLTREEILRFQEKVWAHYTAASRQMPWRTSPTPYHVLVSELMLQQTQVSRVIPKFEAFIATFPTIESLAEAPLSQVLLLWSGLGYNRRAKFLHECAKQIVAKGRFPQELSELVELPGVGVNTAAAILNYAFEVPTPYVETNIRTIFFHEFPEHERLIHDRQILEFVRQTLDDEHPREWFYALMDYGSSLKTTAGGQLNRSLHYKKQTPLEGSIRQVRGRIIRALAQRGVLDDMVLRHETAGDKRYDTALQGLINDGLVKMMSDGQLGLTGIDEAS